MEEGKLKSSSSAEFQVYIKNKTKGDNKISGYYRNIFKHDLEQKSYHSIPVPSKVISEHIEAYVAEGHTQTILDGYKNFIKGIFTFYRVLDLDSMSSIIWN